MKTILLVATLLCGTPVAEAGHRNPANLWQLDSYSCPFGCAPLLDSVLKPRVGSILNLNNPGEGFDLFTECDGVLGLQLKQQSKTDVIRELNETIDNNSSKTQRFTAHNTGLKSNTLTTAEARCTREGSQSSRFVFRVVSLTDESMWVLYEGSSILKFRAIESD